MTVDEQGPSRRDERRADTIAEIKAHAWKQLATKGAGGISLRGIARDMKISPGALFHYFDGQADLITALCVDAYDAQADALQDAIASGTDPTEQLRALCHAVRRWALEQPAAFTLIAGTPIPGYSMDPKATETVGRRILLIVSSAYLTAVRAGDADPDATDVPPLSAGPLLTYLAGESIPETAVTGIVLNAWASILGFVSGEVFGSLSPLVADTATLFDAHVTTVMRGMGFRDPIGAL
ncbi:putative TetR family transcriptional regulator [Gordonia effusa NBRC 100432]|uniref:Putative TetR family transcriptional regulator n=1 Tax=Gordonia effusa NBRC 100432 TaxID=1077974 RepID=H0R0X4_9ACTN|nr:TetR/AcrR family transcriptional regulator [Gordonia effusa]GAB18725.1 putative TetR family transcriptional regulator [Gordonia effusa NBRC 100432]